LQVGADIPPEILNNVGALMYKPGNLEEAREYFEKALERTKEERMEDETYYSQIAITLK
jgi:RNA polymerase-associated protein CTR9